VSLEVNIKEKRKAKKFSQEYVAEKMEVSRQAVSKWETGKSEPSTNNLKKLAELFSCSIDDLLSSEKSTEDPSLHTKNKSLYNIIGVILCFTSFILGMFYAEQIPLLTAVGILGLSGTMYFIYDYFKNL
jgi:transcriptional regulator with XRE-family HTH domain